MTGASAVTTSSHGDVARALAGSSLSSSSSSSSSSGSSSTRYAGGGAGIGYPFRGSAFGYFTDKTLTAEDFFVEQQNLEKPDTKKQQWGGTIGGPIIRDKMHFFFSFERQNRIEGRSRNYTTRPDRSFTAPQQSNYWNYLGRVDHQLNSSHNYSVRYLLDHQPSINQVLAGRWRMLRVSVCEGS